MSATQREHTRRFMATVSIEAMVFDKIPQSNTVLIHVLRDRRSSEIDVEL